MLRRRGCPTVLNLSVLLLSSLVAVRGVKAPSVHVRRIETHCEKHPWTEPVNVTQCCCRQLTVACLLVAVGQIAMDCCLDVKNKEVDKALIADYSLQVRGQGCAIDAMLLLSRHHRSLCVPPTEPWVKKIVRHVDHLKKFCKKRSYKPTRCFGVKPE